MHGLVMILVIVIKIILVCCSTLLAFSQMTRCVLFPLCCHNTIENIKGGM